MMDSIARGRQQRRKRDEAMMAERAVGKTYAEIGRQFGLSQDSVVRRIERERDQQRREQSTNPFDKLKPYTFWILNSVGLTTVEQVVQKYHADELLEIPRFGFVSLRDVEQIFLPGAHLTMEEHYNRRKIRRESRRKSQEE